MLPVRSPDIKLLGVPIQYSLLRLICNPPEEPSSAPLTMEEALIPTPPHTIKSMFFYSNVEEALEDSAYHTVLQLRGNGFNGIIPTTQ